MIVILKNVFRKGATKFVLRHEITLIFYEAILSYGLVVT
jgi:hypothetical protein